MVANFWLITNGICTAKYGVKLVGLCAVSEQRHMLSVCAVYCIYKVWPPGKKNQRDEFMEEQLKPVILSIV
jgi:hypothetical protein